MSRNTDRLSPVEIAVEMTARLQELHALSHRLHELQRLVPSGSHLQRGLALVERDVQAAGHDLERLCAAVRATAR